MSICKGRLFAKKETFLINSPGKLGGVAKRIVPHLTEGSVLCISGDLGVGKTVLAQSLCHELGIEERVTSPTFTILKRYWIVKKNLFINHFDFFRVTSASDVEAFHEIRDEGINIIEWPEKVPSFFSEGEAIMIKIFFHQVGRRVEFSIPPKNTLVFG